VLLVLDNFEHVLDAAGMVAELLAAAPAVKALITSRAPLRIRAEQQYPLAPLAQDAAVALFAERARAVRPEFSLSEADAEQAAALCAQVDYLPLAIELIAVRARTFSLAELRQQLAQPLDALVHGARDLPDRHRSLRNAVCWSYERLGAGEQRVFAHLGVFSGGATAQAVQAVVDAAQPALPALQALVEASLAGPQEVAGETRFTLLEILREFALEQLTGSQALAAAQQRHAEHFTALVEHARPALSGPDQRRWFDRLDTELANLRAALRWCLAQAPELGLRLAAALDEYWNVRGRVAEGRRWLAALLALEVPVAQPARAEALRVAGWLAIRQGDPQAARALAEQSRGLFRQLGDDRGVSGSLNVLGEAAILQSDFASAQTLLEESLALVRGAPDAYAATGALKGLAEVAQRRGDYATARRHIEQRLAIYQAQNDPRNTAGMLHNLGVLAYEQEDYAAARAYGDASLAAQRQLDDQYGLALSLLQHGNTLSACGDLAGAQAHLEEALAIHRRQHDLEPMAAPLNVLAKVLLGRGDPAGARAHSSESLRLRVEAGDRRGIAVSLRTLAAVDHACGQSERAARLLGAVEAIRERIGVPVPPNARAEHEQFVAAIRAALGDEHFEAALAAGRALPAEQAAALALT
jgi:predicted ATPase